MAQIDCNLSLVLATDTALKDTVQEVWYEGVENVGNWWMEDVVYVFEKYAEDPCLVNRKIVKS